MDHNEILDELESRPPEHVQYAGFWIRVAASLVDFLVLSPIIVLSFYNLLGYKSLLMALLLIVAQAFYKPFMEYKYGATLGKMAVKIKVVTTGFKPISINQTILRDGFYLLGFFASIFSTVALYQNPDFQNMEALQGMEGFMAIGVLQTEMGPDYMSTASSFLLMVAVIVVAFDARKQGLHDKIAGTYCVYAETLKSNF